MPKKNELEENIKIVERKKSKSTRKDTESKKTSKKTTNSTAKSASKNTTTKNVNKSNTKPKSTTKTNVAKKKANTPSPSSKKTTKKGVEVKADKPKETVVKRKIEKLENLEKKEKQIKEKIDEASVIEKIKNFLSKIIAMQEDSENIDKKDKDKKDGSVKKEKNYVTPEYLLEYYDLPYRYNETIVKILAQTPKRLFVYWDISDKDREKYIKTFGEDFFYKTYPVLLLYNEDKKYIKEIPINDFANSWYIDIQDPKNKYTIQLGRKFIGTPEIVNMAAFEEEKIILRTDYLPFADSNKLEVPNDHVLLESLPRFIVFRNVKTNQETIRELRSFKDIFGNTYNVKEFYQEQYDEELTQEGFFDMANPSSASTSSTFK